MAISHEFAKIWAGAGEAGKKKVRSLVATEYVRRQLGLDCMDNAQLQECLIFINNPDAKPIDIQEAK